MKMMTRLIMAAAAQRMGGDPNTFLGKVGSHVETRLGAQQQSDDLMMKAVNPSSRRAMSNAINATGATVPTVRR